MTKGDGENIKVAVRVRPLSKGEIDQGYKAAVTVDHATNSVRLHGVTGTRDQYTFDHAIDQSLTQRDIFVQVIVPMVEALLNGYNATVFAYGQSGSGKTHTMTGVMGNDEMEGVSPRAFKLVLKRVEEARQTGANKQWRISASYLELYNNKPRDLLCDDPDRNLPIKEDRQKNFFVQDLSKHEITDYDTLVRLMDLGTGRRRVEATNLNAVSSRSHAVFCVYVELTETLDDGSKRLVTSKLNLVDLAGSERQAKTGAEGDRLKEGASINLSLTNLGTVIDALVKGTGHVPFRSSPLTQLLKDSLGGGSKTLMFANMGPSEHNLHETISTLRFADRAKQIKNKPQLQMDAKDLRIKLLEDQVEELKEKLKKYDAGLGESEQETLEKRVAELETEKGQAIEERDEMKQKMEMALAESNAKLKELENRLDKQKDELEETGLMSTVAGLDSKVADAFQEVVSMISDYIVRMTKTLSLESKISLNDLPKDLTELQELLKGDVKEGGSHKKLDVFQNKLDALKQAASEGLSSVKMKAEIDTARREAAESVEAKYKEMMSNQAAEIARTMSNYEENSLALEKAVERLAKQKERIDKEKAARQEAESRLGKAVEDAASRHTEEVAQLKGIISDLEGRVSAGGGSLCAGCALRSSGSFRMSRAGLSGSQSGAAESNTEAYEASVAARSNAADITKGVEEELKRMKHDFQSRKKVIMEQMAAAKAIVDKVDAIEVDEQEKAAANEKIAVLQTELANLKASFQEKSIHAAEKAEAAIRSADLVSAQAGGDPAAVDRARVAEEKADQAVLEAKKHAEELRKVKQAFAAQKKTLISKLESLGDGEEKARLEQQLLSLKDSFDADKQKLEAARAEAERSVVEARSKAQEMISAALSSANNSNSKASVKPMTQTPLLPMDQISDANIMSLQSDVARLAAELDHVQREASLADQALRNEREAMKDELSALRMKLEEANRSFLDEKQDLEFQLKAANERLEFEMKGRQEASIQWKTAVSESERMRVDYESLIRAKATLESRIPELEHAAEEAQIKIDNATGDKQRLFRQNEQLEARLMQQKGAMDQTMELLQKKKLNETRLEQRIALLEQETEMAHQNAERAVREAEEKLIHLHNERMERLVNEHTEAMRQQREDSTKLEHKLQRKIEAAMISEARALASFDEEMVRVKELEMIIEEMKVQQYHEMRGTTEQKKAEDKSREIREAIKSSKNKQRGMAEGASDARVRDSNLDQRAMRALGNEAPRSPRVGEEDVPRGQPGGSGAPRGPPGFARPPTGQNGFSGQASGGYPRGPPSRQDRGMPGEVAIPHMGRKAW